MARAMWLWLIVAWLMTWHTEAIINPSFASVCDLGPCSCMRGKLLCDCTDSVIQDIMLKNELFDSLSFSSISVTNCSHVHVSSQALSGLLALQQVSLDKIATLTLDEQAFSWTTDNHQHIGLLVNITDCAIPEIPSYCFQGSLRDILLTSVNISRIRSFAFTSIDSADKIEFYRVNFGDIESQSFKKFSVDFLTFSDSYVPLFPTRTMINVDVHQETRFDKVKVDRIETSAFKIHESRNFRFVTSTIGHIEPVSFLVFTKGDVSIHDNTFSFLEKGAFVGFTVERMYLQEAGKQDFVFENNTLVNFESECLTFNSSGFNPRLDWIMIDQQCSCPNTESWATDVVFFSSDPNSKTPAPQVSAVMYCFNPTQRNIKDYRRLYCNITKTSLLVKVLVFGGVILTLSAIGVIFYCAVKNKGKRYINVPTSPSAMKAADYNKAHMLVVPEGKTYRETELHVIVEHAEPIIPTEYVKERPDRGENQ